MKTLNKLAYLLLLGLIVPMALVAQERGGLFISSAPIRAEVMLDGTPRGTTPLLVRDLEPGEHQVTLIKSGYHQHSSIVPVEGGAYEQFRATMEPNLFVGAFAATETIVGGTTYDRQDARLVLPAGTYEFSQSGSSLSLNPVYPYESALRSLRVATPVIIVAAVIATVEDLLVQDSARSFFTSYLPSPATFATWTAAAASSGFLIALRRDKQIYESQTVIRELETGLTEAEAERFFLDGDLALEEGNIETALNNYMTVLVDGGDSEYVPLALYKAARLYSISGEAALALALPLFELLIRDYPVPETYDGALKSISDIYVTSERYQDAIAMLEQMVFVDELYDPATIQEDIRNIRTMRTGGTNEGGTE